MCMSVNKKDWMKKPDNTGNKLRKISRKESLKLTN